MSKEVIQYMLLGSVGLFTFFSGLAMWLYPGGHTFEMDKDKHHFWFNFLCDVMTPTALNGKPNQLASSLMMFAVAAVYFLGLLPLWWGIQEIPLKPEWLTIVIRLLGVGSVLGALVMLFAGIHWIKLSHEAAVMMTALPGIAATVLAAGSISLSPSTSTFLAVLTVLMLGGAIIDLILYVRASYFTPPMTPIVPILQRIVVLILMVWMLQLAYELNHITS